MQDPTPLNDPRLEALAGRLAAAPPRLGPAGRDALLYQCGFAAGRQSALRGVRRWSLAAACLAILAGGVGLMSSARHENCQMPAARPRSPWPRQNDETHLPATRATNVRKPAHAQRDSHPPGCCSLDPLGRKSGPTWNRHPYKAIRQLTAASGRIDRSRGLVLLSTILIFGNKERSCFAIC